MFASEIKALLEACTGTARLLEEAHSSFRVLLNVMGCDTPVTLASAGFLLETVRIVETAPFEQLHLLQPSFESERSRPMLQAARQQAAALKNDEASLGAEFDLSLCAGTHTPAQLLECAAVLDNASLWKRFFGRDYRGAVKTYRRVILAGKKAPRAHMSRALRTVADYAQKRMQFDNHASYREMLGVHFQGMQTPWDDLNGVLVWYERIFVALPEHQAQSEPFRHLVFTARSDRLKAIKASLISTEEHRAALDQIVSRVADFTRSVPSQRSLMVSGSFDEILDRTVKFNPQRSLSSLRRGVLHNAREEADGSWVWRYDRRRREGGRPDLGVLWDDLSAVGVPLLLVRGGDSPVVDDDDVAELRRRQPSARVEVVAGAGHSIQGDKPLELARILEEFVGPQG